MSAHTPQNLLKLWKLDQLPTEMAIGHIVQNLVTMQETIDILRRTLAQLGATVNIGSTQQREHKGLKGKQKSSTPDETLDLEQSD